MYPYINLLGKTIGSYGLMLAFACITVGFLSVRKAIRYNIAVEDVLIVGACGIGLGLFGGKLLYIFATYSISQIWDFLIAGDLHIFGGGGIVFYGGLLGGVVGALVGIRIAKCSFVVIEKTVVPYIPLGHAIGRIGCLLAGCCYGMPYDGMLAVYYPNAASGVSPEQGYFPIQILEALWNILVMVYLLWIEKRNTKPRGVLFEYLCAYAVGRFVLEFFRGDEIRGAFLCFSLSQWISVAILLVCFVRHLYIKKKMQKSTAH